MPLNDSTWKLINDSISNTTLPSDESKPDGHYIFTESTYHTFSAVVNILGLVVCASGVCSNSLTIITFIKIGSTDGVTFSFLSLAVSDLAFTVVQTVTFAAYLCQTIEKKYSYWFSRIDPRAISLFGANISNIIYIVCTLITAYVAIVRCMCVAMPFKFKNVFTRRKAAVTFVAFAICSIGVHLSYFGYMGVQTTWDEKNNASRLGAWVGDRRAPIKNAVQLITFFGISFITEVIVVICVSTMTAKLRDSVRFRRQQKPDDAASPDKNFLKLTGKEKSVVKQVVVISAIFIICNLFQLIHSWIMLLDADYGYKKKHRLFYFSMARIRMTLNCVNSSVNFYIYLVYNQRFRSVWVNDAKLNQPSINVSSISGTALTE